MVEREPVGSAEVIKGLTVGEMIKVVDKGAHLAKVLALDEAGLRIKVHFDGWNKKYDTWYFELQPKSQVFGGVFECKCRENGELPLEN